MAKHDWLSRDQDAILLFMSSAIRTLCSYDRCGYYLEAFKLGRQTVTS